MSADRLLDRGRATCRLLILVLGLVYTADIAWAQDRLPQLEEGAVITTDGYRLPSSQWLPETKPCRVVLGLHGFNDYRETFDALATRLSNDCTAFYAYDQRGFGDTKDRGRWVGRSSLINDVDIVTGLLRERYPEIPLYIIGESMGGAVALLALTQSHPLPVDGVILMAPAVWGYELQPWYQRASLWLAVRIMPGFRFSSEWIDIDPSDDPDVLEYWRSHPKVIQRTRTSALYGVSILMDAALAAAGRLQEPALILYGGEDEVIPPESTCALLRALPENRENWRFVYYPEGYHMLARYSGAARTVADIQAWLDSPAAPLPSGRELHPEKAENRVCEQ